VPPARAADPSTVYPCYKDASQPDSHQLDFETHEWQKHGACAGVADAADFFTQVCRLAAPPLLTMDASRAAGKTASADFAADLTSAGFPVFSHDDTYGQVMLSACADAAGQWHVAPPSSFASTCGSSLTAPPAAPSCPANAHGPPCASDADCHYPGCLRCAHSGFCTATPLAAKR